MSKQSKEMDTATSILKRAHQRLPALKYAEGVAALAAAAWIVASFVGLDIVRAVVGVSVVLLFMVVLLVFERASRETRTLRPIALIMVYSFIILTILIPGVLFSSAFFKWPLDLTYWVTGNRLKTHPDSPGNSSELREYYSRELISTKSSSDYEQDAQCFFEIHPVMEAVGAKEPKIISNESDIIDSLTTCAKGSRCFVHAPVVDTRFAMRQFAIAMLDHSQFIPWDDRLGPLPSWVQGREVIHFIGKTSELPSDSRKILLVDTESDHLYRQDDDSQVIRIRSPPDTVAAVKTWAKCMQSNLNTQLQLIEPLLHASHARGFLSKIFSSPLGRLSLLQNIKRINEDQRAAPVTPYLVFREWVRQIPSELIARCRPGRSDGLVRAELDSVIAGYGLRCPSVQITAEDLHARFLRKGISEPASHELGRCISQEIERGLADFEFSHTRQYGLRDILCAQSIIGTNALPDVIDDVGWLPILIAYADLTRRSEEVVGRIWKAKDVKQRANISLQLLAADTSKRLSVRAAALALMAVYVNTRKDIPPTVDSVRFLAKLRMLRESIIGSAMLTIMIIENCSDKSSSCPSSRMILPAISPESLIEQREYLREFAEAPGTHEETVNAVQDKLKEIDALGKPSNVNVNKLTLESRADKEQDKQKKAEQLIELAKLGDLDRSFVESAKLLIIDHKSYSALLLLEPEVREQVLPTLNDVTEIRDLFVKLDRQTKGNLAMAAEVALKAYSAWMLP